MRDQAFCARRPTVSYKPYLLQHILIFSDTRCLLRKGLPALKRYPLLAFRTLPFIF